MADLSPAAQAVLHVAQAAYWQHDAECPADAEIIAASALRAAADQVVPSDPCGNDCCITQCEQIRSELLVIAAELENHQ